MKLRIISVIVVILILVMSVPVYADTPIPDPPSNEWEYWVIYDKPNYGLFCIFSETPITVTMDGTSITLRDFTRYYYEDNQWKFDGVYRGTPTFGTIYQSSHDIAYEDGSGFFFLRPKISLLYPTMKTMDFGTILRTFSVGLIPLLGLMILVISLLKAWEFLRTQLMS